MRGCVKRAKTDQIKLSNIDLYIITLRHCTKLPVKTNPDTERKNNTL